MRPEDAAGPFPSPTAARQGRPGPGRWSSLRLGASVGAEKKKKKKKKKNRRRKR